MSDPGDEQAAVRVLVAEDDDDMRELVVEILSREGLRVEGVADALALRAKIEPPRAGLFGLIVSDVRLPGGSGLAVLEQLKHVVRTTPIILMTAFSDDEVRARAAALGARLLDKPFDRRVLCALAVTLARRR